MQNKGLCGEIGEQDYAFYYIPMLTCLTKLSLCTLLLPVEAARDPSASFISDSLNAPRDPERSCGHTYSRWPSRGGSWKPAEGVAPSGRLWDAGWLYMRRVVVAGQRRARGGKAGQDFVTIAQFSVVLS